MKVRVFVSLKDGVLDPQGKAVEHALHSLGFEGASDVRISRVVDLCVKTDSAEAAKEKGAEMARALLANEVIEDFRVEVVG
ncbi:phosphoribosylformylglycinamidine synthase [Parasaccharibacter sp. TMW2.1882]|uniref:Phosphoribosylformylglycinamidine synthase subunit PurS n=2 Tax=Bombella apis TaxID=1785988 RepID=A0ABR9MP30_9PROT|nr:MULTISPECIES: phosphoribosylformylglycinamidine synthase subunit PurS [Acetobacteraceae]MCL1561881.1 phosphoribosylformylglycinamidine synthase subunit PurS [Parasaccharibacter sp. TMW 2.1886]MCQ0041990.1 phosphoribosylformylglycinamidine synthase subunit PurS [Bombella sp.]MUH02652.1 phosphoribosylformylglycinamidine synthase subunit PurS [Bombella sp. ESL0387]QGT75013.1 phosphoribosylformylglycinamidine synthase subunit PurS [Bombella sp. ESL0368]MBE1723151.1 phosphoribosylformylglycinami